MQFGDKVLLNKKIKSIYMKKVLRNLGGEDIEMARILFLNQDTKFGYSVRLVPITSLTKGW